MKTRFSRCSGSLFGSGSRRVVFCLGLGLLGSPATRLGADPPSGLEVGSFFQEEARHWGVAEGLPGECQRIGFAEGRVLCETSEGVFELRVARWVPSELALPPGPGLELPALGELLAGAPRTDFTGPHVLTRFGRYLATSRGLVVHDGERWRYRQGRRWLSGDEVLDLALGPRGEVWAATRGGVTRLRRRAMTLAEKAAGYERAIDRFHRRTPLGFVLAARLARAGDLSEWTNHDSDNDGLWTAMYGASQCYRYAVTRSPDALRKARGVLRALEFLGEVTQGGEHPAPPGFVARTILPTDGPDPNAGREERDREFRRTRDRAWKLIAPRWPRSADGKWYWKCDTSSDELDGHFFFYALFHDLVAETPEERARVAKLAVALVDHLLEHDFNLVDHDGEPTRWGRFGPRDLNLNPQWWEERGLNSMSLLSYLAVAGHVSGDSKYREAAQRLIDEHGYAQNVLVPKVQDGPGTGNQSDDEMAFMGFYNLVRYERDAKLRSLYTRAFARYAERERLERNPLFNFLFAAVGEGASYEDPWGRHDLSPVGPWLEESLDTLQRFPLDLRNWRHGNSGRLDLEPVSRLPSAAEGRGAGRGAERDGYALPIDERYVEHWNHDPFRLDSGGDGRTLADGTSFLLPYWLGRYHGFLRERGNARPRIELSVALEGEANWDWTQVRTAFVPAADGGAGLALHTLSRTTALGSHGYHDIFQSLSEDRGKTWSSPQAIPGLERRRDASGTEVVAGDFWPRYHPKTRRVLATGKTFNFRGGQREDFLAERVSYAVFDPAARSWGPLSFLDMPERDHSGQPILAANAGCNQRVDLPSGDVLLPVRYQRSPERRVYVSTVVRCRFDGEQLRYLEHGSELTIPTGRGLYEPSLARSGGEYFITLRADDGQYVAKSGDGLRFSDPVAWRFDDGRPLGSYNTQAHWLGLGGRLHLVYTRRGLENDHILRHRAPLLLAEVDRMRLRVRRKSEQIIFPDNHTALGNSGVCQVSATESWVTCGEYRVSYGARKGQVNRVLFARIHAPR